MPKTFTGVEFVKALTDDALRPIIMQGMVKQDASDSSAIQFTPGTSCHLWTKIPVEMIDRVEIITAIRCLDHEHPFVEIILKEPPSDNPIAAVLAELIRRSPAQSGSRMQPFLQPEPLGSGEVLTADRGDHDRPRPGDCRPVGWRYKLLIQCEQTGTVAYGWGESQGMSEESRSVAVLNAIHDGLRNAGCHPYYNSAHTLPYGWQVSNMCER